MAKGNGRAKHAEMDPFFREQLVARRIYMELMALDKPSRRRVLGIVNDYAMTAEKAPGRKDALKRATLLIEPPEESPPDFVLDDEDEAS
jgi:hypothetical protein